MNYYLKKCFHIELVIWASQVVLVVNNPAGDISLPVPSLGPQDHLEKGMATHSGILAREFPGQRTLLGYSQ